MVPQYEQFLIDAILPELDKGREGWDKPHTEQVVRYVKEICENADVEDIEKDVLVIVAYLHDFGYMFFCDELTEGPTGGRPKKEHPGKSKEKWDEIKNSVAFDFLSNGNKDRIGHLILVHDRVTELSDRDELLFMEADTLGALCMGNIQKIEEERYRSYIYATEDKRISRFITEYSKKEAKRLVQKALGD